MAAVRTYPNDVKDDKWAFVAPYLWLMRENAPKREYALHDFFDGMRYLAHTDYP